MKIYYPKHLDKIMHISNTGNVYRLDSFWKLEELKNVIKKDYEVVDVDEPFDAALVESFHTPEFVKALVPGINKQELIESCGVFWQPWLPLAMSNIAKSAIYALENLIKSDNLSILLADLGHHTIPNKAYGFGPINALGVALSSMHKSLKDLKIAVLDLDTHQGNGFSFVKGENIKLYDVWSKRLEKAPVDRSNSNYFNYQVSDSKSYKELYNRILDEIVEYSPQILVYYSGVDVVSTDRFGGIPGFTEEMLKEREEKVFKTMAGNNIGTLLALGGGYVDYRKGDTESQRRALVERHLISIRSGISYMNE